METTKKIYLDTLKSVLGRSILHYFLLLNQFVMNKPVVMNTTPKTQ